jgi:outer membrane immunogenic protein
MKLLLALAVTLSPVTSLAENFNGAYLGGLVGSSSFEDKGTGYAQNGSGIPNGWAQTTKPEGTFYGLMAGYNWILDNNILLGVEADYDGQGKVSDRSYQRFYGLTNTRFTATTKLTSVASLRARLGYSFSKQALIYATAGYAAARVNRKWHDYLTQDSESHSAWQDGWTAGLGVEYLLLQNLSAGLEYRYAEYGTEKVKANLWNEQYKQRLSAQSLRLGIAYRF